MLVSGFTFLRNAEISGYPYIESILSILPLVDEFICAVGPSVDETRKNIESIKDPKLKIIDTEWNENMRDRGFVYGQQKMIAQYQCQGDWAFYLEGDEVLHEADLEKIKLSLETYLDDHRVEAFYFDFLHFYGTPYQTGIAGYRQAPRIIRNSIRTIAPDGLFWVVLDKNKKGRYPRARHAGAHIYHYGHCRNIEKMREKLRQVSKYWGGQPPEFHGYGNIDIAELRDFKLRHPAVMTEWIAEEAEHTFTQIKNYKLTVRDRRNRLRFWLEQKLDVEISKKHFRALD